MNYFKEDFVWPEYHLTKEDFIKNKSNLDGLVMFLELESDKTLFRVRQVIPDKETTKLLNKLKKN